MDLSNAPSLASAKAERLAALAGRSIFDSQAKSEFSGLTRLAAIALGVEDSAISLVGERRQWFRSRHDPSSVQTPRDIAFCMHIVASRDLLVVPDARYDERFSCNSSAAQGDEIRFYAGVPLIASSGRCLGTLCVFDSAPRSGLTQHQEATLNDLGRIAIELIESRRFRRLGEIAAKVVDATSDAILAADLDGTIVYWNPAAELMFGRSHDEAIGQNIEIIIPPRFITGHRNIFEHTMNGDVTRLIGTTGVHADGREFPVEFSLARWGETGPEQGFAAIVRDTSERKALEREREHAKAFLDSIIANLPAMLFVKDVESRRYLMINRAGEGIIGRPASEIIGFTDRELFPDCAEEAELRDAAVIENTGPHIFESPYTRADGEITHLRTIRTLIDGPDAPNQYLLGVTEDVTQIRIAEAEVLRLAHYDALTGLLNRASFTDLLHRMVQEGEPFAMLSIDLDRFKAVNDQFGHPVGDDVLSQVGDRLRAIVTASDWVARIGGDEFIVILTGKHLRNRAQNVANAIITSISEPFVTAHSVAYAGASVGVVLMPEDGITTDQLRENADLALYRAKHNGKASACFFNADMDASAQDRREIERDLRKAVAADEIELAYQPLVSAQTGQITSAEALARWTHPVRGPIRPDIFISTAEECGMIDILGEQLLRRACMDAQSWPSHVRVAVNLSPMQFISDKLLGTVRDALASSKLAPNRLQLEVTEGLVIRDVERTFQQLEQLRTLGIQILIDDFGVGYSSLSYFQRFPFDKVKIDKSFVHEITTSRAAKAIIQAVVGLGHQLEMGVVAEGVETQEQMEILAALGCTHLQGYLFSRPLPADMLRELLETGSHQNFAKNAVAA